MIDLAIGFRISTILIFPSIVLIIIFCNCYFLTDNATKLAYQLESVSKRLKSQINGSEVIVCYETEDSKAPFTILILPEHEVSSDELYQKGLDSNFFNKNLFNLRNGASLTVDQNGIMSGTTYYRRFVDVTAPQIISGTGNTDIVVKKVGVGHNPFTDEVIIIELHKQINK